MDTEPRKPDQPMTAVEFKRFEETRATLGIGDKISLTTFLDYVGQRAISQDYMARISSIGDSADEMDDESIDALGALYGEMLRLMAWKYQVLMDFRKAGETNNLLKALKLIVVYNQMNREADGVVK